MPNIHTPILQGILNIPFSMAQPKKEMQAKKRIRLE